MTNEEFSNQFDTLLNSFNIQAGFGEGASKQSGAGIALDEYEKSTLLTQAQDTVVKSYFDRTLNNEQQGFDDTVRRQVDFSSLIKVKSYTHDTATGVLVHDNSCYDSRGLKVKLESNILFVLNEKLSIQSKSDGSKAEKVYVVVPINYREYDREMSKAYAQPLKKQAWRLFSNATTEYDIQSEIIPIYGVLDNLDADQGYGYTIRYVERPTPIILRRLPNDLTIDGYDGSKDIDGKDSDTGMRCSLNPILHMDILNKAFELAVTTRGGGDSATTLKEFRETVTNK